MKKILLLLAIFFLSFLASSQASAATGICSQSFTDSAGTTMSASDWCTACRGETFEFCKDGVHYSFECKDVFFGLACSCDEKTAKQEACTAGCINWYCSQDPAYCIDGKCNQAKTCSQLGGSPCPTGQVCKTGKILGATDSAECCQNASQCSLSCANPSKTDKTCTPGCTTDQDPDCGCKGGNGVCPTGCTNSNDSDCSACIAPVKGDKICTPGCTVDQDPDCGCKSGDYYCGIGCDYTKDTDCAKTCSQFGKVCCPDGQVCGKGRLTGSADCAECCEDASNCATPTCSDPDGEDIYVQGTCRSSVFPNEGTDSCGDNNTVREFSCVQGKCSRRTIACPSGEVCSNGVCVVGAAGGISSSETIPKGKLEVDWPPSPIGTELTGESLTNLIKYLYEWGIGLGGLAAFISLVIAGFQYLTSVGNVGRMSDAMKRMQSAGLGLALLFGAFLILNTINPQLTDLTMPSSEQLIKSGWNFDIQGQQISKSEPGTCTSVLLYPNINFEGSPFRNGVKLGQYNNVEVQSIIINGGCSVMLYDYPTCSQNAFGPYLSMGGTKPTGETIPTKYDDIQASGVTSFGCVKISQM